MRNPEKFERKFIAGIAKFFANEEREFRKWKTIAKVVNISGWALISFSFFKFLNEPIVPRSALLLTAFGGLFVGVGTCLRMWAAQ